MKLTKIFAKILATVGLLIGTALSTLLAMVQNVIPFTPLYWVNAVLTLLFAVFFLLLAVVFGITIGYVWSKTREPYLAYVGKNFPG